MKKFSKIISVVLAVMLMMALALPVSAAETTGEAPADLLSAPSASGNPSVYSNTKLKTLNFKDMGVSISLPDDNSYVSLLTDAQTLNSQLGVQRSDLLKNGLIVYPVSYEGLMFYFTVEETLYSKSVDDYSKLSTADKQDMIDIAATANAENGADCRFITVNGNDFFVNNYYDASYGLYQYSYTTVVDGVEYSLSMNCYDKLNDADFAFVENSIVGSIRIKGFPFADGTNALSIVLLVLVIILVIVVAFLTFFIIRFNAFAKAAGSSFQIIGFNMPGRSYDDDDDDDDDYDYEDDDDEDDE